MTTTWADIQRLASDLQQVQLAGGLKKLSEANCVEVVAYLIGSGSLNLVVSTDAKEYVTFSHLQTEIRNECSAAGNRIELTVLAAHLRVELNHVENAVAAVLKDGAYILCNGELVHRSFIDDLCLKINARLHEMGQISLFQLAKTWDVPAEFITNFVLPEIGHRIQAIRFEEQIYTTKFIAALKRQLIAILSSLTKIISLSAIHAYLNVSQSLFFTIWGELTDDGQISRIGQMLGAKNSLKSVFVPKIHMELAKNFVRHTISDKGFIDSTVLKKLSISDQTALFKELFPSMQDYYKLIFLPSVVINTDLWAEIENNFKQNMDEKNYCVVENSLPASLSFMRDADLKKVSTLLLNNDKTKKWRATADSSVIFDESTILDELVKDVEEFVSEKAKTEAPRILAALRSTAQHQQQTKLGKDSSGRKATHADEDDWSTGGKGGKKKGGKKGSAVAKSKFHKDEHSQSDSVGLMSINADQLASKLSEIQSSHSLPDALMDELEEEMHDRANALFREAIQRHHNSAESAAAEETRKTHEAFLQQARSIYTSICVFESGANALSESLSVELKMHLLKTLATELANVLLAALSNSSSLAQSKSTLSVKIRNEHISAILDKKCQEAIQKLFNSIHDLNIGEFHKAVESLRDFSLMLRQPDKSSRQEFLQDYCAKLRQQIITPNNKQPDSNLESATNEAPLTLLSFVLFCLGHFHQLAIHASGKFVSQLSAFLISNNDGELLVKNELSKGDKLEELIPAEILNCVLDTQKHVVALLRRRPGENDDENSENVNIVCDDLAKICSFLVKET